MSKVSHALGVGALTVGLTVAPDVGRAALEREAHVQVDATRAAMVQSLGQYAVQGAPREAEVLAKAPSNEGRVSLVGQPELTSINPENLVGNDMVDIGGDLFWLQKVQVKGGQTYYYIRRGMDGQKGALCVASDVEGGVSGARAALDKFFGDVTRSAPGASEEVAVL